MTLDIKHFQKKLLEEKALIENDLAKVARQNPDNPEDWEAVPAEHDAVYEENTAGDSIDEYEKRNAVVNTLEPKLREVKSALDRISNSTYGVCSVCGKEIEQDRLEANPSASTCKEHM
jgi:RNA polymerase-binding transcription factor DksA